MQSSISSIIASLSVHKMGHGLYEFTVSYGGQPLYADAGFSSITEALIEANNYEGPIKGFELAYGSIVIGTYLCSEITLNTADIADHAIERCAVLGAD